MSTPQATPPRRKSLRILFLVLILIVVGLLLWFLILKPKDYSNTVISVSGRVEGDDSAVAAKTAGRIKEISVREGDEVKAGQVLALLDDDQIAAREQQAQAAVQQAEARVQRSQQQIAVLEEQLDQSRIAVSQSKLDAQGRVNQAEAQIASAEAQLAQAQAAYEQARYDAEKFSKLARQGDVSERSQQQATTTAEAQAAAVRAARKQVDVARGALTTAKANLANPAVRSSQAAAVQKQIQQAESDIDAAKADAERARAQLVEAQANRADLQVIAPFDGTVTTRTAEPGEVVAAGTPVLTVVNLGQVYLRGFVPEDQIGHVKVGQRARVYLDASPNTPIDATVTRIDPEASFTPENTYFRNDRVKQVFGLKLQINSPQGAAKPGMPADGEILVQGSVWPRASRVNK
jgi:HlyD family secretion protein